MLLDFLGLGLFYEDLVHLLAPEDKSEKHQSLGVTLAQLQVAAVLQQKVHQLGLWLVLLLEGFLRF